MKSSPIFSAYKRIQTVFLYSFLPCFSPNKIDHLGHINLKTSEVIPSSPSILKRKRSLEMSESKAWIMNYDKIKINKKKNQHHRRFISGRRLIFLILLIFIFSVLEISILITQKVFNDKFHLYFGNFNPRTSLVVFFYHLSWC